MVTSRYTMGASVFIVSMALGVPVFADEAEATATTVEAADNDKSGDKKKGAPRKKKRKVDVPKPHLFHAPRSVVTAHEDWVVQASVRNSQLMEGAVLLYRRKGASKYTEVPFRRGAQKHEAVVPGENVTAPGLEYAIEAIGRDAKRLPIFASRARPFAVQVPESGMDLIEEAQLERLEGRRSEFSSRGEYVSFGPSRASVSGPDGLVERVVDDRFYRIEGAYTYRPLRVISEFSIRVGVIRGSAPVPVRDLLPGQSEDERFDVGLNYGAPSVRFRLAEHWHLDGSFLANVTEVGFSVGTGAALHIGDIHGTKVSMGFEAIQEFGVRLFTQMDIQAVRWLRVSPIIEVTNMPSADRFGVRLLGELGVDIGWGFGLSGRGGYQARDFASGGFSAGGAIRYGF